MSAPLPTNSSTFGDFRLDARIQDALAGQGFETPTKIQAEAIPALLDGHDVIGRSRTGSGKTAAFALPALERIKDGARGARVLVLAPTRELAIQVHDAVKTFSKGLPIRTACIYGGASYGPQLRDLKSGAQFIVATPGRLMDHMDRGSIDLSGIEVVVLDEADEMLRMGFIEAVEEILSATPSDRQVCLFSATMPKAIRAVADTHLTNPVEIQVEATGLSTDHIVQRWMMVPIRERLKTLVRILQTEERGAVLIFAKTRRDCAELADGLGRAGVAADALHGALNQAARERVLHRMRSKQVQVVVATDVAARGIDVEHITHVINAHLPPDVETYVHRIGRTGRAGREGVAISFGTNGERRRIQRFERALKTTITLHAPPSKRDVAIQRREGLERQLDSARKANLEDVQAWVAGLTEKGWTDAEVAAAAMQLVSEFTGVSLGELPAVEEPKPKPTPKPRAHTSRKQQQRSQDRGSMPDFDAINQMQIIVFTGSKFGVRPGDLVGAIANEYDISGNQIGKVALLDRKSFVGLPREIGEAILENNQTLTVRGRPVRIDRARPLDPEERAPYERSSNRAAEPPRRAKQVTRKEKPDRRQAKPFARKRDDRGPGTGHEPLARRGSRTAPAPTDGVKASSSGRGKAKTKTKLKNKLKGKGKSKAKGRPAFRNSRAAA